MSPSMLEMKRHLAITAENSVSGTTGVALVPAAVISASYPHTPDVPGVWVRGPDSNGRYSIELHVSINVSATSENLLVDSAKLRSLVWAEFRSSELAAEVERVDVIVEDIDLAV